MNIEEFNVYTDKINDLTIAHISDLHISKTKENVHLDDLVDAIKKIKPVYIVMTGDYFAGHKTLAFLEPVEKDILVNYLNELKKIAPIVLSLGNHDIKIENEEELRNEFLKLEDINIHPVDRFKTFKDETRKINFIGYMQPKAAYSVCDLTRKKRKMLLADITKYMSQTIIPGYYNIGLIHTPIVARDKKLLLIDDYPTKKLDLILCGHHHNGLVNYKTSDKLEKLSNNLQRRFPKHKEKLEKIKYISYCEGVVNKPIPFINFYARGMHLFGGVPTIISKGVGSVGAAGSNRNDLHNQVITKVKIIKTITQ